MKSILLLVDLPTTDSESTLPNAWEEIEDAVMALGAAAVSSGAQLVCSGHRTLAPLLALTAQAYSSSEPAESKKSEKPEPSVLFYSLAENESGLQLKSLSALSGVDLLSGKFESVLERTDPEGVVSIGGTHRTRYELEIYLSWRKRREKPLNVFILGMTGGTAQSLEREQFPGRHFGNEFVARFRHLLSEHQRKNQPVSGREEKVKDESEKFYVPYAVITQMIVYEILNGKPWQRSG
ncbi:MAG TPA: hypothetical protein VG938_07940 [Verrucomicrobiae bacterium]|jgi:hypothetical protein|nr:hypothetical protein [Verrucomicrobiae bacterium]